MKHIWLIGMMGSGKSAVGKILASKWGREHVDLDREVERSAGLSVAAIFRRDGEAAFRALEAQAIARAASGTRPSVIATGGGAVLSDVNVERMRDSGQVVWLDAPASVLTRRVAGSGRPLLRGRDAAKTLSRLIAERRSLYASAADVHVDSSSGSPASVARRIEEKLESRPVVYRTGGAVTAVHVGAGILDRAGALVRDALGGGTRAIVVTDENVGPRHARRLKRSLRAAGWRVGILTLPPGERHKNAATMESLWIRLVASGIDRKTPVLALGGGVVGDLAGFAAATILRGVPLVQVPTTLVAQVDSAIGGKTGFDLAAGKNLVGAFKQPVLTLVDPTVLATLPARELRAGLAEVVKYGAIADAAFFALLESLSPRPLTPAMLERIVRRCVELKAAVVERDPEERGVRVILNFGHTAGHALEAASRYRVRHGEAVAAGMVAEAEWACEQGLCSPRDVERLTGILSRMGLPVSLPSLGASRFLMTDKKRAGAALRIPLLRRIGRVDVRAIELRKLSDLFRNEARRTR